MPPRFSNPGETKEGEAMLLMTYSWSPFLYPIVSGSLSLVHTLEEENWGPLFEGSNVSEFMNIFYSSLFMDSLKLLSPSHTSQMRNQSLEM
jgi:hypothetical protein